MTGLIILLFTGVSSIIFTLGVQKDAREKGRQEAQCLTKPSEDLLQKP